MDFAVNDLVWVSTKNWKTDRLSRKLGYQQEGLYCIIKQIRHLYRLDLPAINRVHPVFSTNYLYKALDNLLLG